MRQILQFAGWVSVAIGVVLSLVLVTASKPILSLFLHDPEALRVGVPLFRISMLAQASYGGIYLFTSFFQAAGKVLPSLLLSISQGAIFIPCVIVGSSLAEATGVAAALPISEAVTALLGLILYFQTKNAIYQAEPAGVAEFLERL
jgi:multidrug efflux pump